LKYIVYSLLKNTPVLEGQLWAHVVSKSTSPVFRMLNYLGYPKGSEQWWSNLQFALWAKELCHARHDFTKRSKKLHGFIHLSNQLTQLIESFCEVMFCLAKLLSPEGVMWYVSLMLEALELSRVPTLAAKRLFHPPSLSQHWECVSI